MDQSKALHRLMESADLVAMVEDLLNPSMANTLSSASWAGLRITLRSVREQILSSHDTLAGDLVTRAHAAQAPTSRAELVSREISSQGVPSAAGTLASGAIDLKRKDLRSQLEKMSS